MKIVVMDGQGGKMGKGIIEKLKESQLSASVWAIGTNSIATAVMLRAGADFGATGENAVLVNCRDADVIVGPIGIVVADALLGEVSPAMATAVGQSAAQKVLLPINKCNNHIVGIRSLLMGELLEDAVKLVVQLSLQKQ